MFTKIPMNSALAQHCKIFFYYWKRQKSDFRCAGQGKKVIARYFVFQRTARIQKFEIKTTGFFNRTNVVRLHRVLSFQ